MPWDPGRLKSIKPYIPLRINRINIRHGPQFSSYRRPTRQHHYVEFRLPVLQYLFCVKIGDFLENVNLACDLNCHFR